MQFYFNVLYVMENNEVIYWEKFEAKIKKLHGCNPDLIQVVSDFDWTLTYIKDKKKMKLFLL